MTPIPTRCVYAWHWSKHPEQIKIGFTQRGTKRWPESAPLHTDVPPCAVLDLGERTFVATLATDTPRAFEQIIHTLLSQHRVRGEWFEVSISSVVDLFTRLDQLVKDYEPTEDLSPHPLGDDDPDHEDDGDMFDLDLPISLD